MQRDKHIFTYKIERKVSQRDRSNFTYLRERTGLAERQVYIYINSRETGFAASTYLHK